MLVIDFRAGLLSDILGAVTPAMSSEKNRPMLNALHFEMHPAETARVWATDSYRLHSVELETSAHDAFMNRNGSMVLPADAVKTLSAFVKAALKNPEKRDTPVGFAVDESEGFVALSTFKASCTLPLLWGESPNCASILAMADNPPTLPACFNGGHMADLFKSAQVFAGKTDGAVMVAVHDTKPTRVESVQGPHRFVGVLMPQRQPKR